MKREIFKKPVIDKNGEISETPTLKIPAKVAFPKVGDLTMAFFSRRADTPSRSHVFSSKVYDANTRTGKLLRFLGMSFDDPSNRILTKADVDLKLAEGRAALDRKTETLNKQVPQPLKPYFLLPNQAWTGESGHRLLYMFELNPFDDWNIAFLPVDEMGAIVFQQPAHPGGDLDAVKEHTELRLREIFQALDNLMTKTRQMQSFGHFPDEVDELTNRVKRVAQENFNLVCHLYDETFKEKNGEYLIRKNK